MYHIFSFILPHYRILIFTFLCRTLDFDNPFTKLFSVFIVNSIFNRRPLELDTDGIWCILPASFPENFVVSFFDLVSERGSLIY